MKTPNDGLQLRRAISIQAEGKRLLERDAIAPSAARLCSLAPLPGNRRGTRNFLAPGDVPAVLIRRRRNIDLNWINESPQRPIPPRRVPRGSVVIDGQIHFHRIVKPANAALQRPGDKCIVRQVVDERSADSGSLQALVRWRPHSKTNLMQFNSSLPSSLILV
jgi:hypothetical protein